MQQKKNMFTLIFTEALHLSGNNMSENLNVKYLFIIILKCLKLCTSINYFICVQGQLFHMFKDNLIHGQKIKKTAMVCDKMINI